MGGRVSPYERPNDRYGYALYGFVLMANPEQQAAVLHLRDMAGNRRSMIPGHVTVKGPVCEIPSLDEIKGIVRGIAAMAAPFAVVFSKERRHRDGFCALRIEKTPELVRVHNALYNALDPIVTHAYSPEAGDDYHPHMTLFHEPDPTLEAGAHRLADVLDLGAGFTAKSIHLMGHVGPPYRGQWVVVQEFPLLG